MFVFLNSSTSSYNVVSVCIDGLYANEKLELIDLGGQSNDSCPNTDLSWRTLHISEFDNFSRERVFNFKYCMSSKGVFYILALQRYQSSCPTIICADLVKQTCTTLNAPKSLCFRWHEVGFQLWRGQPSIIFILEEKLNVWMLEDYKKQKWADTIVIPIPFLEQNAVIPHIYEVDNEECLFYHKYNSIVSIHRLVIKELYPSPALPVRVSATLVSVKGMQSRIMKPGTKYIGFPTQRRILVKTC